MDYNRYDAFEVHPCRMNTEINVRTGFFSFAMEQCDRTAPDITNWSVYGHVAAGGLEWVCDCGDEEDANQIANLLALQLPSDKGLTLTQMELATLAEWYSRYFIPEQLPHNITPEEKEWLGNLWFKVHMYINRMITAPIRVVEKQ